MPRSPDVRAAITWTDGEPGLAAEFEEEWDYPPDLASILLHHRIVYLGMPLVPAVTELIIAELLYLEYEERGKPISLYINSTGTTRADNETVGLETEGTAIYDAMRQVHGTISTLCVGVAIGQACMLLSAGTKGQRFMMQNATAMLHQPRVPPTGLRQAIEIQNKWKHVLSQKQKLLDILSRHTGHSPEKIDRDMRRPFYMNSTEAIEYGIIDCALKSNDRGRKTQSSADSSPKVDKAAGFRRRRWVQST